MRRLPLAFLLLLALPSVAPATAPVYPYQVINVYPHDTSAYTEGLYLSGGFLYESTGLFGPSSLRKVDLQTGEILKYHRLPADYFGEGIAALADSIYQLTWRNHVGLTYVESDSFRLVYSFPYEWEGWGLTEDTAQLIASDGTSTLRFLDPSTRQLVSQIDAQDGGTPVSRLNELEFVRGKIYANVYGYDQVAVINPGSGQVEAWLDLSGLRDSVSYYPSSEVLNGIAYDEASNHLLVTGKFWPKLFEIDVPTLHSTAVGQGVLIPREGLDLRTDPNPCRDRTILRFYMPKDTPTSLRLFSVRGKLVLDLLDGTLTAGDHVLPLDVRSLPAGAYFAKLVCGADTETRRLLVVR
jgi:glutamine cyclotransferase